MLLVMISYILCTRAVLLSIQWLIPLLDFSSNLLLNHDCALESLVSFLMYQPSRNTPD